MVLVGSMVGNYQIFQSIIRRVAVYVMHNFTFIENPSKMLFHNEPISKDIFPVDSIWMMRDINHVTPV